MNGTESSPLYSLHRRFSHLYVEREARDLPLTRRVTARHPEAEIVEIENYREFFNRPRQNWREQKRSLKLIVAVKHGGFLHRGNEATPDFGFEHFYYTTPAMNCVYDCGYCFLQGMYRSANIVVFANEQDFFSETDRLLKATGSLYLSISYDTDLLAIESLTGTAAAWIEFARGRPGLTIEIRTKSANARAIEEIEPVPGVIFAWTLSPQPIIESYELRTPALSARLRSARELMTAGWRVRLCVDPILQVPGFERIYGDFIERTAREIELRAVHDISLGTFRMSREHFTALKHSTPTPELLKQQVQNYGSMAALRPDEVEALEGFVERGFRRNGVDASRIVRAGPMRGQQPGKADG